MKRTLLALGITLMVVRSSFAGIVSVNYAQQVAQNFYNNAAHQNIALTLFYTDSADGAPVYYVFNAAGNKGFVIVSAENLVKPVLGYGLTGAYTTGRMAPATAEWMTKYHNQIVNVRINDTATVESITRKWSNYYNNVFPSSYSRSVTKGVSPLCGTLWNQEPYYNDSCPYDQGQQALTVTGCVATAMAQIMKYWGYPLQGNGSPTDYQSGFGPLTVNLGAIAYNWGAMPNSISSDNPAIAQLMYDCGVAVGMNYGVNGSGAEDVSLGNGPSAQNAYSAYFGYDPNTIQGLFRANYDDSDWINMMEAELDTSRVVQYGGFEESGEGHSWVCDGYDANDYFHMNWGWGGYNDAYYSIDNLDPSSLGINPINDSNLNLNYYEDAIIGIEPLDFTSMTVANISLADSITMNQAPYAMNTPLSVQVPIVNADSAAFTGALLAGVYDQSGNLITNLKELTNVSINGEANTVITFSTNGVFLFPGNYVLQVSYKTRGLGYTLLPAAYYFNPVPFTVVEPPNDLLLDSSISFSKNVIDTSTPFKVNTYIRNAGGDFTGTVGALLFGLDDNLIQVIDSTNGAIIFAGASVPFAFNCSGLHVAPGQYYVVLYSRNSDSDYTWVMVSDSLHANPVLINVQAPGISAGIADAGNADAPLSVYPNPAQDVITIDPGNLNGKFELAVFDLAGKKLHNQDVEIQQGQLINEYVGILDNGIYMIRLLSASTNRTAKLVIAR